MIYDAVVIGSGAAGLACAVRLRRENIEHVALITECLSSGTSRNTGSDKQTYYKLSLGGDEPDSVLLMAQDLYRHGGMNGYEALNQAANSARAFMLLLELGVPFACNEYGEYPGYRTDHDLKGRATSCGPLTSKYMTEALEKEALRCGVTILDGLRAVSLIVEDNTAKGVVCVNKDDELSSVFSPATVLACGGEASLYSNSVFPCSQWGGMGLAVGAGAVLSNMNCWQYGIASKGFRWNLSGSYQQALPRYVTLDSDGNTHELLTEYLGKKKAAEYTFLKGYEWPFDVKKLPGSSQIDLIVYYETQIKKNTVYLDFTNNAFDGDITDALPEYALKYLGNCDALCTTPVQRLRAINEKAYRLYLDNGTDLEKELLPIHVAAQHQSGGAAVDMYARTTVGGLYAVGEAAGSFGAYRPGGSALNAGQTGALRAAQSIALHSSSGFTAPADSAEAIANNCNNAVNNGGIADIMLLKKIRDGMDTCACHVRDVTQMEALFTQLCGYASDYYGKVNRSGSVYDYLLIRDTLLTACSALSAMLLSAKEQGSNGSALVCKKENILTAQVNVREDNINKIVSTKLFESVLTQPSPLPERELWFERLL